MTCESLVSECFAGDTAPFAVHALDRERALTYLQCCLKAGLRWKDAEARIRTHLASKGVRHDRVVLDIDRARKLLKPWLD